MFYSCTHTLSLISDSSRGQRPTQLDSHHRHHHHSSSHPYPTHNSHRSSSGRVAPYSTGRVTDKLQAPSPTTPVGDHFVQKMIVVQDFHPQEERNLMVRKGERVEVICKEDDWLLVRNERGREGYIPKKNCVPPVSSTKRTTPRAYRPLPIRPVGSNYEGTTSEEKRPVPLYSSSSAGHPLHRYNSPMTEPGNSKLPMHSVISPSSHSHRYTEDCQEGSSSTLDPKHSPSSSSGVASLTDPYSPALNHTYSPDDLKVDSSCSLTASITTNSSIPLENGSTGSHRKHSGSDDSGTEVGITTSKRVDDYASTVRCADSSSEDGSTQKGSSMRDRPLPSPPSQQSWGRSHVSAADSPPPPVPPRHTSLDRHTASAMGQQLVDEQYASPVDSITNGEISEVHHSRKPFAHLTQQGRVRSLVDITAQDNGTYSEVFQSGKPQRRQTVMTDTRDHREGGNGKTRRSASFHRNHSAGAFSLDRRGSPGRGANKQQLMENSSRQNGLKQMSKFRKYLWGVYAVREDFEGVDENEVSVKEGEHVMVFNQDDQDWFWVVKHKTDNTEGFVPSYLLKEVVAAEHRSPSDLKSPAGQYTHTLTLYLSLRVCTHNRTIPVECRHMSDGLIDLK